MIFTDIDNSDFVATVIIEYRCSIYSMDSKEIYRSIIRCTPQMGQAGIFNAPFLKLILTKKHRVQIMPTRLSFK
jgi:hypothetical protein